MDPEKLEEVFDEAVWNLMQALNNNNADIDDARRIMQGVAQLANYGQFEMFYSDFEYERREEWFKNEVKEFINL